jgi:hypothetical protein
MSSNRKTNLFADIIFADNLPPKKTAFQFKFNFPFVMPPAPTPLKKSGNVLMALVLSLACTHTKKKI